MNCVHPLAPQENMGVKTFGKTDESPEYFQMHFKIAASRNQQLGAENKEIFKTKGSSKSQREGEECRMKNSSQLEVKKMEERKQAEKNRLRCLESRVVNGRAEAFFACEGGWPKLARQVGLGDGGGEMHEETVLGSTSS